MDRLREKQKEKTIKLIAKLNDNQYRMLRHKQRQLGKVDLATLRRRHSGHFKEGRVSEVFDILEGTLLADKMLERVHFTKKPIIKGNPVLDIVKYNGPSQFRHRTGN
jgi:hypothetical protein